MQNEMLEHTIKCLRKQRSCKACKELINDDFKEAHLKEWRSNEVNINDIES
jgi:hypothetical protein